MRMALRKLSCALVCSRPRSQNNRLVFLWCFWPPQLCSVHASGPLLPLSVGPWDWLITSFVSEGKRGMSAWLLLSVWGLSDEGARTLPGRTSGPLHTHLVFNSDKWVHFLKSIRSVFRKWGTRAFFLYSCRQSDLSWSFLLFSSEQMGSIVPGTAGWLSAYFGCDGWFLFQIWVMTAAPVRFP